jgi:hypothetical protein
MIYIFTVYLLTKPTDIEFPENKWSISFSETLRYFWG